MSDYSIVTGGAGSIGASIAERLTADGFNVVTVDREAPSHAFYTDHLGLDLSDAGAKDAIAAFCADHRVTRVVNAAGVIMPASLEDTDVDNFDLVLQINARAAMLVVQGALPSMRRAGIGRIVNIASRVALGKELRTAYAASKAALIGMTRTWALELARDGITVNAISPGPIRTKLFDAANPADSPRTRAIIAGVPVGHLGEPRDVAAAVGFFCSSDARFVTGQTLYVCGGITVGLAP
jgi:3-oxoacyl-[acyl-carrier protein] reductase